MEKLIAQAIDFIKARDNFLLTTHVNSDCDGVGALIGCAGLLKKLGKKYEIILPDPPQEKLSFLKGMDEFRAYGESVEGKKFKAVLIFDVPNLDRIGQARNLIAENADILNVDHHISNENFGTLNLVLAHYAAASHIAAELFRSSGVTPDAAAASALYAGIITDTGRFRFDNTKPETFRMAAWLVECGADPEKIARLLFYQNSLETVKALGKMLDSMEFHNGGKLAISRLDYDFLSSESGSKVDTEGFVNNLLGIKEVETAFLLREYEKDRWRVSLRSQGEVNVNELASKFGGGGHPKASGASIEGTFEDIQKQLLKELEKLS